MQQSASVSSGYHGELFYATFKSVITEFLVTVAADALQHLTADETVVKQRQRVISSVITSMLDVAGRVTPSGQTYVHLYFP